MERRLLLKGYFDSNFGDDMMIRLIAEKLAGFELCVEENAFTKTLIESVANITAARAEDKKLPVLVVTGCGFMVNTTAALKHELKFFLSGRRYGDYCLGCNIEPFKFKLGEYLIRKKLGKFKLIVCRDKKSFEWLSKSCPDTELHCLPDILFGISGEMLPETQNGTRLGISLMRRAGDDDACAYYKSMAAAADYWIEHTGNGVTLMALDTGGENDVLACRAVKRLMRHGENVKVAAHGGGNEITDAASECRKIIAARFHAGVLAIRMGIDVYPVIYRRKMSEMIRDVRYPVKGCMIDNIDISDIKRFLTAKKLDFKLDPQIISEAARYAELFKNAYVGRPDK